MASLVSFSAVEAGGDAEASSALTTSLLTLEEGLLLKKTELGLEEVLVVVERLEVNTKLEAAEAMLEAAITPSSTVFLSSSSLVLDRLFAKRENRLAQKNVVFSPILLSSTQFGS